MYFHAQCYWWIHWNYTGITLKSHWMGYTETTLELHWKDTLKVHWNSTAPPAHPNCTSSAPQLHLQRTPTAPPAHNCTSSAPQLHLQCTTTAPQTAHLQHTSNSAPPSTPTSFTYLHLHLQRTPTAPPSTTAFTNPCLAIKSEVHLSAPQKCTPPQVRCAPPSTSAHPGTTSELSTMILPTKVRLILEVWQWLHTYTVKSLI